MLPKHAAAKRYAKSKLFTGLGSFAELEQRIAALPSAKERGDAFEVFAEAYLATQRTSQAKNVWPFEQIPPKVKRRLSVDTARDMGVDGVFETHAGEFNAYQVKFRTDRPALTWQELSTFMGLTERVERRVLFTNCDALPPVMNDREGFYCIRGSDLDRINADDFKAIKNWLSGRPTKVRRKKPLPHQRKALTAIQKALIKENRTTSIMACGTGKTLVALWIAERTKCKTVIVLVPSLALVRQTLHEWLRETSWGAPAFICVCSDPTVAKGTDEVQVNQSDLDFPVTTDATEVAAFLQRKTPRAKIVFSTYQSAHLVGQAVAEGGPFDLGIFDEAHKTAGREGAKFGFALSDEKLPIRKRLFLTATPRHYDVSKLDKEGDARPVFSMDDPEVYGRQAHCLTFAEAARANIICDYKVVISVVTSEMVTDELLKHGEVIVEGDQVKARQVANQIALQKAVEQYGIRRIFTFHRSVASAKSFTAPTGEGVSTHLPDFQSFHVNGKMPTATREATLGEFADTDQAVISNARCLTEGVDVPAVDLVAFMSPKKSRVDIVQATGRAMRLDRSNPRKTTGFVLVPIYLEQEAEESLEDALERTDFGEVWNVLQAMQEQDTALAETIRQMREERGRTKGYDDSRLREKFEVLGPSVLLGVLREAITAKCLQRLGHNWDEMYGELVRYKDRYGDCEVPSKWDANPRLGVWVNNQRSLGFRGSLSTERYNRLDDLGFTWDTREAAWEENFKVLRTFHSAHGHCNVTRDDDPQLARWVSKQRTHAKQGALSGERMLRLDHLGFIWDVLEDTWRNDFALLKQYRSRNGHCNVSRSEDPHLGTWISTQRTRYSKGTIDIAQVRALEEIGFVWNVNDAFWEKMFAALLEYKAIHGDTNVPQNWPDNPQLGTWVGTQRSLYARGKLDDTRINRLQSVGFVWTAIDTRWEEKYGELVQYAQVHGNCNVPARWPQNHELASWVGTQRQMKKRGKLSSDRVSRLNNLSFEWDAQMSAWDRNYAHLVAFREDHGHCNVPSDWKKNVALAKWVNKQRHLYTMGRLPDDQVKRLETLGFIWNPRAALWEEMFSALLRVKEAYGHTNLSLLDDTDPRLANWVNNQRRRRKRGELSKERIERLDAIGFSWGTIDDRWEQNYQALRSFEDRNGHCNVPARWPENPSLARWVDRQRAVKKTGKITRNREILLNEIGFSWRRYKV